MRMYQHIGVMAGIAVLIGGAWPLSVSAAEMEGPILSFMFDDATGHFDGVSAFTVSADHNTRGYVSRLLPSLGTAIYGTDFTDDVADFTMSIGLAPIDPTHWLGSGLFSITDADGDTITGNVNGMWTQVQLPIGGGIFSSFAGTLSDVGFNDNGEVDGFFDGPDLGSFGMDFGDSGPHDGAVMTFGTTGSFLQGEFWDDSMLVHGMIVPEAGTSSIVLSLGCAAMLVRRRR
ncbi:MAG: hypothetical protein ABII12_17965 [Planctomycetota bacterium]